MIKRLLSLFTKQQFDADACVKLLLDRTQPLHERDAAAESLLHSEDHQTAIAALVAVIRDSDDDYSIRKSAASILGAIFNEIGMDAKIFEALDSPFKHEVLAEISPSKAEQGS